MEIQVKIDGEFKTFRQDKVNFQTIRKCLEWNKHITRTQENLFKILNTKIDEETDDDTVEEIEELTKEMNGYSDLDVTLDLIMSFFEGHFTVDQFLKGCYFQNIADFYNLGQQIYLLAIEQKKDIEGSNKKKPHKSMKKI